MEALPLMDIVKPIEDKVNAILNNKEARSLQTILQLTGPSGNSYTECDFLQNYKKYILSLADTDIIKKNFNFPVISRCHVWSRARVCAGISIKNFPVLSISRSMHT